MSKKTVSVAVSLLCIAAIVLVQFVNTVTFADQPLAKAPVLWYEDDFESENPAKITLDSNAKIESDEGRISIGVATEEGSSNKVLEVVKRDVPANPYVNTQRINLYPQKPDGSYGLVNDGALESGKTYRYIVTYDYKVADLSGANGMYVFTSVAQKGASFTNDKKNSQGYCLASNYLYTQDIGDYGLFNLVAPLGEWQTVSTATYCSTSTGISDPAIIMQFELWRDFIGTVYFDNIKVYKVDENDDVATVIFDANDNGVTRLNPVTYVRGASYNLPVPAKTGFDFLGWYADSEFTELCDNALPKNKVNGKYTVLYARWGDSRILTDDFDQKNAESRSLQAYLSVENNTGFKSTNALRYSASSSASSAYVPIDLKGNRFKTAVTANQTVQYIAEFDYKSPKSISSAGVKLSFDMVNASDNKSIVKSSNAGFCVSPTVGNADGVWHKASFALRFTPDKSVNAAVVLKFNSSDSAEILIDNLSFRKMSGRIGSFVFERDEFTEYIDPVAGEYGELSGVSLLATRKGYVFDGWYSGQEKISVDTFDAKDYTLSPKWKELTAPENTTEVFADDFDGETPYNRNIYDDVIVGPDTSGDDYCTDDFEQYNGNDIDINDNYKKDDRPAGLSLTTEKEADGNAYFRFKNTDNVLYRQNLIFRDPNGDPLYNKSLLKTKKYTVIYKFRYKVIAAPGDGMWMTSVLCNANTNDASGKSKCFIIAENKTAGSSYFYGNTDGNWHTVSFAANFQPTSDNPVTPGFFLEFGSQYGIRKVDICFDDVSVKVIEGQNKAINYACSTTPKSGQPGPTLEAIDVLTAEVDTHINFPNPYSDEYKFVNWTNTLGKAVTTAPKTSNGSTVTVYPKWESLE
ncbi:MAG: InlB B-repeat-containing protein, partial [Clostridia bacterium]|nr:InlB B-repeat-containing protein [Clostridia bacterium]